MNVFSKSRKDRKQGRGSASGKGSRKDGMAARKGRKAPKKTYRLRTWLQSGRLSRLMVIFMVVVSLGILGVALFREQGILDMLRLAEQVASMRADMDRLAEENTALQAEIGRLRNDPDEVERIARDVLGLVRPGDTVYEFIEKR